VKKWSRILLFILGLTTLFLGYQNFTEIDFKEFEKFKAEERKGLSATSPEGLAHELIYQNLPGLGDFENSITHHFDGNSQGSGVGGGKYQTEVALTKTDKDQRWKASLINTNSVKMTYEDIEVICSKDGDVNVNKKISNKSQVEFSRRPANDSQNIMLKYSW
jgi:hypothetical protein